LRHDILSRTGLLAAGRRRTSGTTSPRWKQPPTSIRSMSLPVWYRPLQQLHAARQAGSGSAFRQARRAGLRCAAAAAAARGVPAAGQQIIGGAGHRGGGSAAAVARRQPTGTLSAVLHAAACHAVAQPSRALLGPGNAPRRACLSVRPRPPPSRVHALPHLPYSTRCATGPLGDTSSGMVSSMCCTRCSTSWRLPCSEWSGVRAWSCGVGGACRLREPRRHARQRRRPCSGEGQGGCAPPTARTGSASRELGRLLRALAALGAARRGPCMPAPHPRHPGNAPPRPGAGRLPGTPARAGPTPEAACRHRFRGGCRPRVPTLVRRLARSCAGQPGRPCCPGWAAVGNARP